MPKRPGKFDSCIIFAKNAAFPLRRGAVEPGTAALIDSYSFTKIEDVTVRQSADHTQLRLSCPTLGSPGVVAMLLGAHFVPLNYDTTVFEHGMGWFETYLIWSRYSQNGLMLPPSWMYRREVPAVKG